MHNFKELHVWQKSRKLVKRIYSLTRQFPVEEFYSLTLQIRKSSISIPSNIAEGAGRNSNKEFQRFLDMANGSAFELETQIILAFDLGFISDNEMEDVNNDIIEIQKMIFGLKSRVEI
jgi:four helix bundle protein